MEQYTVIHWNATDCFINAEKIKNKFINVEIAFLKLCDFEASVYSDKEFVSSPSKFFNLSCDCAHQGWMHDFCLEGGGGSKEDVLSRFLARHNA